MTATKVTIVALALIAGIACVQAAGGIKGGRPQQSEETQQRVQAVKGLRPPSQQQYLPPPPPQQQLAQPPQQSIKAGPGQVAPVFSAIRVQPAPQPQPQSIQQQIQQIRQEQAPEPEIVQQQQQPAQISEEIDPNAAAQDSAPAVLAPAAAAPSAASEEEANPRPEPYSFQYAFDSGDSATSGSSAREEQQDASGRVTGFYTLKGEDGRDRRVDYVADASGFRAIVRSNEMGTADKDSADVDWQVQQPSDGQLRAAESATQLARQRALQNPQPQQQQQQQQQQQPIASASSQSQQKFSSPRQRGGQQTGASSQQLSKTNFQQQQQQQQQQPQQQQQVQISQQLQEPFEQIRQTELNTRARKSRHAPFYLYTV